VAGFAALGLAMLSKGPLGLLLPGLILSLWHATRREWRRLAWLAPLALVSFAVYGPWFVACAIAMGSDNMAHEFYAQNFGRFLSGSRGHERPIYYFLWRMWIDFLPWAPLLPFALLWIRRAGLWRDRYLQLCLWWFGCYFAFSSIAATKRAIYLLPLYPAVALILAPWLARVGRARGEDGVEPPVAWPARVWGVTFAGFCALGALALVGIAFGFDRLVGLVELSEAQLAVARGLRLPLLVYSASLAGGSLAIVREWKRGTVQEMLGVIGGTTCILYILFIGVIMPIVNPLKSYRPQAEWVAEQIRPANEFGIVHKSGRYYGKAGAFGYYSGDLVVMLETPEEIDEFLEEHPNSLVLVHEQRAAKIFAGHEDAWRSRVIREMEARHDRFLVVRRTADPPAEPGTPGSW